MDKLVSIIVPVYNVEKYLNVCIESIVNQTYTNLEIILVDDGSKDKSGQLCEKWKSADQRIQVIHKENAGLGFARNSGLDIATGDYVMYIDSDDYISKNMVQKLLDTAEITGSDTVFCGLVRVMEDGRMIPMPAYYENKSFKGNEIIDDVLLEMVGSKPECSNDANLFMSVWHAIYSRKIIEKYSIRFPSERIVMCEDIMYHIDYLRRASCVTYIKDTLYYYRVNPKSLSQVYDSKRFDRQKNLSIAIQDKLMEFLDKDRFIQRENRRLLGGIRSQILALVASNEKNKLRVIKKICKDTTVKQVLNEYPYVKNPLKHRIFNYCLKREYNIALFCIAKTMNRIRKNEG